MALDAYIRDYETYHTRPGNKACHYLGIPMIVFSLLGLLSSVVIAGDGLYRLDAAVILWVVGAAWYVWQEWRIGAAFSIFLAGVYFAARPVPAAAHWALFVAGWIFQGIGHYRYEKRSPAFYKNIEHLLVGPIWIFRRLIG